MLPKVIGTLTRDEFPGNLVGTIHSATITFPHVSVNKYTTKILWKETLSEWGGCAGLGLIPLLCTLLAALVALLTDNEYDLLIHPENVYRELILFCIVTNSASVVIFLSKFNLLQVVSPTSRRLPTALIFFVLALSIACGIVYLYVAVLSQNRPVFLLMLSCLILLLYFHFSLSTG